MRQGLTLHERQVNLLVKERDAIRARVAELERERDEARREAERLMVLVQNWYEGRARIGAHMTFVDQRFYDGARCQRTGWPGDDKHGDGGPPEGEV